VLADGSQDIRLSLHQDYVSIVIKDNTGIW
jgi:hypothetical protein